MNRRTLGVVAITATLLAAIQLGGLAIREAAPRRPAEPPAVSEAIRTEVNRERQARGLAALASHPALVVAAERHSRDMADRDKLDHYGSDGSTWADRCRDAGYPGASLQNIGENVAGWQEDAAQAVGDWMKSPGHRRAILGEWRHCGAAMGQARSGRRYWVIDFGRPPR